MAERRLSRRQVLRGAGAGAVGLGFADTATAQQGEGPPERHIVGVESKRGVEIVRRHASEVVRELDFGDVGRAVAGRFPEQALERLRDLDQVRYVEPDGEVHAIGETLPWGVDRVDADVVHDDGETADGADIAILDTGIDSDHPDLEANLGTGYAVETCSGCAEDWDDDHGHGTHCAGIADAVDNSRGVVGVSTGATLHAVKVLSGSGSGSWSGVAEGLQWTTDRGYDVASMSLGGSYGSYTLRDACQYAVDNGVLVVAAAGNEGPCSDCVLYPAAYATVVGVSATTSGDDLASFSSTGPEVELAAPGEYIYSTVPGGYQSWSGTSMACPHVSGAGAQLMANGKSNTEARDRLAATAEDIGLAADEQGEGLLDVEAALSGSGDTSVAVTTDGSSSVGETTATLEGTLTDLGGASSADVGFEYRESGSSSWTATATTTRSATGSFSQSLDGLASGTDYEFRAVADASDGDTDTGSTASFTTASSDTSVTVTTDGSSSVGETTATLEGSLTDLGGASSADVGFEYRENGASSWTATATESDSSTGSFSRSLDGLASGTDYEFRAVADASDGDTDAGSTASFTTDSSAGGDTRPAIDRYAVSEAGSPNPHAEITAEWAVSDADGDLDQVLVEVFDGSVVASSRTNVSGSSATGSDSFKIKHADNVTFDVRLTVTDGNGNERSRTEQVSS